MGFAIVKETYAGKIRPITIGQGDKAVKVGGESCLPFYLFEGEMPNKPKIAMEIWDMVPEWSDAAKKPFEDVLSDPAAWAKKCVEYGADMVVLQIKSADPNGNNASAEDVVKTVQKVLGAIKVPLIIWGTGNPQKDEEVLKKVCEACQGKNLVVGPVVDANHKGIGASAMGFGHMVIASSPIDVNLAKQVNILLENLGVSNEKILIDPTTGGLGYGLEYSYSVMERLRMAAMIQGDDKLQYPIINNLGNEVWRSKEANQSAEDAPLLGDPERRAILMEAVGAVAYLMSGSSILIMRHPEAVRMARAFIDKMADGGSLQDVAPIQKRLADAKIDFATMSPAPNLKIEEEKKKEPEKKAAPAAAAAKPAEAKKPDLKVAEAPKAAPAAPAAAAAPAPAVDEAAKAKAEAEAKAKAEVDAKAKAEADAKAKEAAAAKAKADAEAAAKAAEDAKKKAEADARAQRDAEEQKLREERAMERKEHKRAAVEASSSKTVAAVQKTELDKIAERLDRIHRRNA